jgi:hypothetical protein
LLVGAGWKRERGGRGFIGRGREAYINIPRNLAPIFVDAVQIIHPTIETVMRHMIWILRSFVLPEVHVTTRETRNVAIQTGAVISRVSMLLYSRVLTMDGKKYWNVCERRERCCRRMKR